MNSILDCMSDYVRSYRELENALAQSEQRALAVLIAMHRSRYLPAPEYSLGKRGCTVCGRPIKNTNSRCSVHRIRNNRITNLKT